MFTVVASLLLCVRRYNSWTIFSKRIPLYKRYLRCFPFLVWLFPYLVASGFNPLTPCDPFCSVVVENQVAVICSDVFWCGHIHNKQALYPSSCAHDLHPPHPNPPASHQFSTRPPFLPSFQLPLLIICGGDLSSDVNVFGQIVTSPYPPRFQTVILLVTPSFLFLSCF